MPEEKHISIDYDIWKSKYLPMEQENERLKSELENKRVEIRLHASSHYLRSGYRIGSIDLLVHPLFTMKLDHESVQQAIRDEFQKMEGWGNLLSGSQALELSRQLETQYTELDKKYVEYCQYVNKLPRIIKWLFRIKNTTKL